MESWGGAARITPNKECEERRLEGILSKRNRCALPLGTASDWIKVKCAGWREANKERWRLFEKSHA
jgi:hypothetical protein